MTAEASGGSEWREQYSEVSVWAEEEMVILGRGCVM